MTPGGFDWPAVMRAGIQGLGLSPATFWSLTPAELLLRLGEGDGAARMGRARLEALAAQFPDLTSKEESHGRDA
jgi:uncharacterized phage protein (TIGR02216 family)